MFYRRQPRKTSICFAVLAAVQTLPALAADKLDRTVLPIPEPKPPLYTELDARNAKPPPRFEVKAPGGRAERAHRPHRRHGLRPVERLRRADPHADRRPPGQRGAALQPVPHHGALLADPHGAAHRPQPPHEQHGRHHRDRHGFPGQHRAAARTASRRWPRCCGSTATAPRFRQEPRDRRLGGQPLRPDRPLADPLGLRQVLRLHRRRDQPVGAARLRRHDPGRDCRHDPNYHFMTDMTDQAIDWMQFQKSLTPDKPFFIYFAPGATHAPHHVPKEWIAKYKGKFDQGWDKLREETLARQNALGVVPAGHEARAQARGDQGLGQALAPTRRSSSPARWRCSPASANMPTPRSAGSIEAIGDTGPARQHAHLLHRRRQRRERRRRHERHVQRDDLLQRRRRRRSPDMLKHIDELGGPHDLSAITPPAGRWRATRRSRGRSRWPPTTAAPATAWSSTGPRASRRRARCARSGTTSSTSRRPSSKRPACPSRRASTARPRRRSRA